MHDPFPSVPSQAATAAGDAAWHALPLRGARLAAAGGGLTLGLTALVAAALALFALRPGGHWGMVVVAAVAGAAIGAWLAGKRHRLTRWRLDAHGLALRRGRWWQTETRVPISRVQHLDLRRGPLERIAGLTTLVVHTAGTRLNAVAIAGLDRHDAERLRDRLARQLDHDDDAL